MLLVRLFPPHWGLAGQAFIAFCAVAFYIGKKSAGLFGGVGLYHPHRFVVVISGVQDNAIGERVLKRLRYLAAKPIGIAGLDDAFYQFTPRVSTGHHIVSADSAEPAALIHEAERLAPAAAMPMPEPPVVQGAAA